MTPRPTTTTEVTLHWRPTARLGRLTGVAAVGLLGALITGHGELVALAGAPLVVLSLAPTPARLPGRLTVRTWQDAERCVEGDEVRVGAQAGLPRGVATVRSSLTPPPHCDLAAEHDGPDRRWALTPHRWGRYPVGPLRLRVLAEGGCYRAGAAVEPGELVVYPESGAVTAAIAPRELAAPLGEHPSRAVGSGVEFAGVRAYAPGDRRRDIDWRSSARHQKLLVRQYAAERAFDLVLVLDTAADAGEPGSSTLDLTVRAASGLTRSYLRTHDRVGLFTFGGPLHWLTPGTGPRQHYRIHEALMASRPPPGSRERASFGLEQLPAQLMPRRAFVALVTALLDEQALDAVQVLRRRGFRPLVIDVLTSEPPHGSDAGHELALRLWRLHREAIRSELAALGVAVLRWDGEADLTESLRHAMRAAGSGAHR